MLSSLSQMDVSKIECRLPLRAIFIYWQLYNDQPKRARLNLKYNLYINCSVLILCISYVTVKFHQNPFISFCMKKERTPIPKNFHNYCNSIYLIYNQKICICILLCIPFGNCGFPVLVLPPSMKNSKLLFAAKLLRMYALKIK